MRRLVRISSALAVGALFLSITSLPIASATSPAISVHPYIVNGDPATIGQFPYYAAVLISGGGPPFNRFYCGGAVLTSTIVITAGHCTYSHPSQNVWNPFNASNLRVLVGTDSLAGGGTEIPVATIIRHPSYDPTTSNDDDLALLQLSSPTSVATLKVVGAASDYRWTGGTATGTVPGFGCYISNSSCQSVSDYPVDLRQASFRVQTNTYCDASLLGQYGFNPITMVCAGVPSAAPYTAPGPCFGDSGGPLTIAGPGGKALLIGLVSWGLICGGEPTAFTRVSHYRTWLAGNGIPIETTAFGIGPDGPAGGGQPIAGDFDSDGFSDLLLYNPGSAHDRVYRGSSNGALVPSASASINGNYHVSHCDLNADNADDLVLYGVAAAHDVELFGTTSGPPFVGGAPLSISGTYTIAAGDFNGDGLCDVLLYRPGSGSDYELLGSGAGNFVGGPKLVVNGNYMPVVGDFNGDGFDDVVWYAPGPSQDYLWQGRAGDGRLTGGPAISVAGIYYPLAGDFNGDGRSDILWYGPGISPDYLWRGAANGFTGAPEVIMNLSAYPVAGDFDGDGRSDVLWYAPSGTSSMWQGRP